MADYGAGPQPPQGDGDRETEQTSPSLMLDPSLLLSMRTLPTVMDMASRNELRGVVIPRMFFEFIGERGLNEDVIRFFDGPTGEREYGRMADVMPLVRELREYQSRLTRTPEMAEPDILRNITRRVRSRQVAQILVEEWAFLTTHSWIASRLKRPFSTFVKAGAFAIEGSRDSFDRLVARTLNKPDPPLPAGLSAGDRLRAISKWVAVGGSSAASLVHFHFFPHPLLDAAFGYFLLFDP